MARKSAGRSKRRGRGRRRDWDAIIDKLNRTPKGALSIRMGSPGSAQVSRMRLLERYKNLSVHTVGPTLYLRLD